MYLVPTQPHHFVGNHAPLLASSSPVSSPGSCHGNRPEATSSALLSTLTTLNTSMERSAAEYSQSGLPSPYPSNCGDTRSEGSSADHSSAAHYSSQQEVRPSNYSTSATPTSEYSVYPPSARSGSFPEHIHRPYHPASNPSGGSGGMAQQASSPSLPQQDGRNHQPNQHPKSDNDVPIDPSIAGPSPTYAYGQQSPRTARSELLKIRKEWKQRKKEEEAARKAEDEQRRAAAAAAAAQAAQNGGPDPQSGPDGGPPSGYGGGRLPPIGYSPSYPPNGPPSAGVPQQQPLPEYNGTHMYQPANYQAQPPSPYGQPSQGMYSQHNGTQPGQGH
ncbi:uncharacterized protein VDAG_05685 [Verticillium dahliae VdLs.17]|uniref:Uncharacterized protein n=1 Tax=Verticillium dahliae (strain VdLs.17 / ATCC MYA-4575 / FGSC 10137) TaxID=498257 RepID=G2X6A3_VERDV|nr:uncharacterized protein VDAG_05685 [Verticillium dahliae VdLs.17]EGY14521.1 hypothetical protein VDAG_05685 [Verticillium dahliae VdLs.17]